MELWLFLTTFVLPIVLVYSAFIGVSAIIGLTYYYFRWK